MRLLFLCSLVLILTRCSSPSTSSTNPLGFVPAKPVAIIQADDIQSIAAFTANNTAINSFLDPLLATAEHWLPMGNSIISYHEEGVKEYKYLLIHPLAPQDSLPKLIGDTLNYNNISIVRFEKQNISRYGIVHNEYYFESDSKILLENSIRLHKKPNVPDADLQKLFDSKSNAFQLFIDERAQSLLAQKFDDKTPFSLADFSSWIAIRPEANSGNVILHSTGLLSETKYTKMHLVANQRHNLSKTLASVPLNAVGVSLFAFDYKSFESIRNRYNTQHNLATSPLDSIVMQAKAIANVYTSKDQVAILDMSGVEELEQLLEKNAEATRKIRGLNTYSFSPEKTISNLASPLIKMPILAHAALRNEMLVLTTTIEQLEEVLTQLANGYSLESDTQFPALANEIPKESSFLLVGLEDAFSKKINGLLTEDLAVTPNDDYPYWLGIGLVESGVAQLQFQRIAKQQEVTNKRPKLLFSASIDTPIAQGPNAMLNHLNGTIEWAIQDEKNNLRLINGSGKNIWTKPIESQIQFPILQVDLYQNSRLQMAYTTQHRFEVIDRNAKPVKPFTKSLKSPLPLAVFDYENSRDYRLMLVDQTTWELRDRKFQKISGFNRSKASLKYTPKHIRIGTRDYIVIVEKNDKLLLLNRRGDVRIKTPADLKLNSNVYLHQNGFVGLDQKNRLFRIETNGKISYRTLPFETPYKLSARGKNMALLTENKLEINGRVIELDFGLYGDPKIHVVNNRTYISLCDEQEEKIFVFDRKGNVLPHFPIYGTGPVTIDNDRKGNVFLATKGEKNKLIVYQIPQ